MTHPRPRFEGRPLPRPGEEVVDQGLAFDLETLISRRKVLSLLGVGVAGVGLAACGGSSSAGGASTPSGTSASTGSGGSGGSSGSTTEIPDETAGPYPGDGSNGPDVLQQSGIVRSDLRTSFGDASGTAKGVPMTLELTITDLAIDGSPFKDVAVYVWHCTREGEYSMYTGSASEENFLRGVQIADGDGLVRFTSIFPACYSGRWPHIHFEVYPDRGSITDATKAIATSQVALPEKFCNKVYAQTGYEQSVNNLSQVTLDSDNVFGDDGGKSQLATVTGSVRRGYTVSLTAPVDTGTEPTGGAAPGGGMPGGEGGAPPAGGEGGPPPGGGDGGSGGNQSGEAGSES